MLVLYTGSNGFLGRNIIPLLLQKNFQIKELSRKNSDINVNLAHEIPDFNFVPDIVFHAAGKAHFLPKNENEEKMFFEINVQGTKNLCHALEKSGLPRFFFFISTVAVYGAEKGTQISENHELHGKSSYAESKLQAERFLAEWSLRNNVILYILRPSLISGKNAPGNLGAMVAAIKSGKYANIAGGTARKSIVNAKDFVQIIEKGLKSNGGTYNVCDDQTPNFHELSLEISKKLGKKNPNNIPYAIIKIAALIGDILGPRFPLNSDKLTKLTNTLTFSNKKIKKELGYKPSGVIENLQL